jgi:membrane fusion protein (multidrug efflux system)
MAANPFQRTQRALSGDEFGIRVTLVSVSVTALVALLLWGLFARIPILKVSTAGRIEPHNAIHRIEPQEAGKVLASHLALDKQVNEGDVLVEFDSQEQKFELDQSQISQTTLTRDLSALTDQIARKKVELDHSIAADEAALREAEARSRELYPKYLLAQQRVRRAEASAPGAISDLEKLESKTEAEELQRSNETQPIALQRIERDQKVRRAALESQLLQMDRDRLKIKGDLEALNVNIAKLKYQIEKRQLRASATGQLVDVVELAADDYIGQGQRLGTILAKGPLRVRARFPQGTVGVLRPGQTARLKLDGYPWSVYGTVHATVASVGTETPVLASQNPESVGMGGTVKVELEIQPPEDRRILLQHGMTTTVEVEVARVSPFALMMRAIGEWNPGPAESGSRGTERPEPRAQNDGAAHGG